MSELSTTEWGCTGCPLTTIRDGSEAPVAGIFPRRMPRFLLAVGVGIRLCPPHQPQTNGFVERYHRTYQQECLAVQRPSTLEEARQVTEEFVHHYNFQRPYQALSCGNQPPRSAFPTLPALRPLPQIVDPDSWLDGLYGWHVERKVDAHGMVKLDLKRYYISSKLVGQRLTLQIDATTRSLHVFQGTQRLKSVPIKGLVGHLLTGCRSSWPICEPKPRQNTCTGYLEHPFKHLAVSISLLFLFSPFSR